MVADLMEQRGYVKMKFSRETIEHFNSEVSCKSKRKNFSCELKFSVRETSLSHTE